MEQEKLEAKADHNGSAVEDDQPGVFVFARHTPEGMQISYRMIGGFDPLAVPALLEIAKSVARQHLGLEH